MKLVSNKPYSSLFVYFPGIDDVDGWTEANPAVYNEMRDTGGEFITVSFPNYSSRPKYFVFKVYGGIDYLVHSLNDATAEIRLYDYMNYSSSDLTAGVNSLVEGVIGGDSSILIKEEFSTVFIARVNPVYGDYNSINRPVSIAFSNPPVAFDYSPHYMRDWRNRIDGTCWNVAGKVYNHRSLRGMGRRHVPEVNVLEAWKHGVYAIAFEHCDWAGDTDGLEFIFDGMNDHSQYGTYRTVSFTYENSGDGTLMGKPFGLDDKEIAVRMDTLLYVESDRRADFEFNGTGECQIRINDFSVYHDFSSEETFHAYGVQLKVGYNPVSVLYNSEKGDDRRQPWFSVSMYNGSYYYYYYRLSPDILFLPNEFDVDRHIPFEKVFEDTKLRLLYDDGYITATGRTEIPVNVGDFGNAFTIGMMLRFPDSFLGLHGVAHGRGIRIYRRERELLRIECDGLNEPIDLPIECGKWHSLFLMTDGTLVTWYWDLNENGLRNVNSGIMSESGLLHLGYDRHLAESPETRDLFAEGSFDIRNVIVADKIFRQDEINRIYQNRMMP